jgi:TRAP-type uncharacterized transport system, fused permease components
MEFSEFFDEELSTEKKVFEALRFGIPFALLIYLLGIAQYTVMTSALYTVVAMMITGVLMPPLQRIVDNSGIGPGGEFVTQVKNTVHGIRRGAVILAPIAIILVVISGVVNLFSTTGIPAKLALLLISISGGVLLFAVLLGMAVAILMGVGMPTVAAYVIVAILIVPTFVSDFGVEPITAHYTMFYAAILAGITPPVGDRSSDSGGDCGGELLADLWRCDSDRGAAFRPPGCVRLQPRSDLDGSRTHHAVRRAARAARRGGDHLRAELPVQDAPRAEDRHARPARDARYPHHGVPEQRREDCGDRRLRRRLHR